MGTKVLRKYLAVIAAIFVCSGLCLTILGQQNERLRTSTLERRLKKEFKLTANDLDRLRPLMGVENTSVARTYGRYSDEENKENFLSLWTGVRIQRWEFEARLPHDLSRREIEALRAARSEFERRVLDLWLDDYLNLLADVLDLDRLQTSDVQSIFENETRMRLQLIRKEKGQSRMNLEWQKITDRREELLPGILNSDQLKTYLSLGKMADGLFA